MSSLRWDYQVVRTSGLEKLEEDVTKFLNRGYEVCGGVAFSNNTYVQAVMFNPNSTTTIINGGKHRKSKKNNLKRKNKTKKRQF